MADHPRRSASGRCRVRWLVKGLGPGGAETLLLSTARLLDERFEVEVDYLLPWKDHLVESMRATGAAVRCLEAPRPVDLRWVGRFARGLRSVDVVHVHSPLPGSLVRPLVRSLPHRPALVTTEHNVWESFAPATRLANRLTTTLDDATIAVSEEVRSSMSPPASRRTEVLVHGVDLAHVRDAATRRARTRHELGIGDDRIVVATVANLRADKAYPDLLLAARSVIDADPDVDFVAVGQGPLETELHALHGELGLGDRFRFLGYQPDAYRITAAADVFVLASHHEGLPVALMEAMGAGVVPVVTDVGGMSSAVRHGVEGLKVPPRSPDALAAALLQVVTDPSRRKALGASAAESAAGFDVQRAVDRLSELYVELAERRR